VCRYLRRDGTLTQGIVTFVKADVVGRSATASSVRFANQNARLVTAISHAYTLVAALFHYLRTIMFEIWRCIILTPACYITSERDEERIDSGCADASSEFTVISHLWQISECAS